ncbi:MAG TPA: twin-arginine translocase TatA/TatE family subunit [Acidimicrobiales bacterium]|jgi:sec-independent protein translocase protein TatA|nr:twin-arginine translocase TatA/TatE family subunit [Acidimicrobiales bacterium]
MPTSLGPAEILVILVVALIVLGPKRLPEAGRQIGKFVSEVRHWSTAVQAEIRDVIDAEGAPTPPPPAAAPPAVVPPLNVPPAPPAPLPTPQDLGPPSTPPPTAPANPAPEVARRSAAAEWGLSEPAPTPAASPAPPSGGAIPAEWETPPSSNGDHA